LCASLFDTAHGFRSTFRDWAAEQTAFARDALAHWLGDKTEAAYPRGDVGLQVLTPNSA
jgi:integrase